MLRLALQARFHENWCFSRRETRSNGKQKVSHGEYFPSRCFLMTSNQCSIEIIIRSCHLRQQETMELRCTLVRCICCDDGMIVKRACTSRAILLNRYYWIRSSLIQAKWDGAGRRKYSFCMREKRNGKSSESRTPLSKLTRREARRAVFFLSLSFV